VSTVRRIQPGDSNSTVIRLLTGVALLRRDIAGVRFVVPYLRSLGANRSAIGDGQPWLTFRAIRWLAANLEPTMRIFEYGSGGSTLFFANRVRDVVSVEHDPEWHARTSDAIDARGIHNCTYLLRPPRQVPAPRVTSTDRAYAGVDFTDYVTAIDAYPDGSFDVVSVDGRARTACVLAAIPKTRPGGLILLDNSDREEYGEAIDALARYERLDFPGLVPYMTDVSLTSIWRIVGRQDD
jgi:hypothetical protein